MPGMEWILELALTGLLVATLFHSLRLERALGGMRRDRIAMETLVAGFNVSTAQAEASIACLRETTEVAGSDIGQRVDAAMALKHDLALLTERGNHLADRLDALIRTVRPLTAEPMAATANDPGTSDASASPNLRSQAERDLLKALRMVR